MKRLYKAYKGMVHSHPGVDRIPKGPSTNIIRTLGFYIGIYYYGLGQVLNI